MVRWAAWIRCCIPTCSLHTWKKTAKTAVHLFPKRKGVRRTAWVRVVRNVMNNQTWEPGRKDKICSRHFLPSDYRAKYWLKHSAIPSVNLYPVGEQGGTRATNGQQQLDGNEDGHSGHFVQVKIEPDFEFEVPIPDRDPLLLPPPPETKPPTFTPRRCPFCQTLFRSQVNYESHLKQHRTHDPGRKGGNCDVSLPTRRDDHVASDRSQQNEEREGQRKRVKCDQCGELFWWPGLLRNHKVNGIDCFLLPVKSADTFSCPVAMCGVPFSSGPTLKRHLIKVHATWKGECLMCGIKPDSLYDHFVQEHGPPEANDVIQVKTEVILEDVVIKSEMD